MTETGKAYADKRVLIVNDDGIDAIGIRLLESIVRGFTDDVWVVAPDEERSGASQSISMNHPIRYVQRDERHFAVRGTPVDCALLGIHTFLGSRKPDILLSGINAGPNLAEDVLYSGTCAAAKEGALFGIASVALSQMRTYRQPALWEASEAFVPGILEKLLALPWPPSRFLNVNVPNLPPAALRGTAITRQGRRQYGGFVPVRREDERFVPYFWIRVEPLEPVPEEGTDLYAVANGMISITPMQLDMTCATSLSGLASAFPPSENDMETARAVRTSRG